MIFYMVLLFASCIELAAEPQSAPLMIQPLEPIVVTKGKEEGEQSTRRIDDFLNDCFNHPALRVSVELSLQATPLREAVELLVERAQLSVVVDDAVGGNVPLLVVRGEPIGSVLHTLLTSHSPPLGILIVNRVLHVAPRTVLIKRARQMLLSVFEPPVHDTVVITWISWTEQLKLRLEAMWQQCIRQYIGASRSQYFFIDDDGHRVIVQGNAEQVRLFKRMVKAIDVPLPQVRIEARIVIARADFMTRFGLNVQFSYGGGHMPFSSVGGTPPTVLPWLLKTVQSTGNSLELPFLFNSTTSMNALNAVLNAAESRNWVRTLLAPQIMSCSGKLAILHEGQSVPIEIFTEDAVEGRTRTVRSANYKDVGVKVQIKPQVLADGKRVRLEVFVENSHLSPASTSTVYPTIVTSRVNNVVVLDDGQTVLLGGLTQAGQTEEDTGIPWIRKLPLIGRLFSGEVRNKQERRLYLFLHARLLAYREL
ncbi:MAG: type pilus assembly protein PilQ [Candidatus Dependentiae bacterium]|nr:type pilus assembly protein PilQ [Candidatus Dependentiae bacterium]